MQGRKGSGKSGIFERGLGQKQIAVKIDRHTVDEMYGMLREEGMSLQEFLSLCVDRYVNSDPRMRGIIEAHRRDNQLSEKERGNLKLSKEERLQMLREIGAGSTEEDV